ncbi:PEP-CTERM sorting domain-containing protein [bacterium]|nr:PEP-CTERM sorting domain-containing protein [bacterium]
MSRFICALGAVLALSSAVMAQSVAFDLDGPTGPKIFKPLTPSGIIDVLEGNAVIVGGRPILSGILPPLGTDLQSYYQSVVSLVTFADGSVDTLLSTTKEITLQAALPMEFTSLSAGRANMTLGTGVNHLSLFFDPTKDASVTAGTGFGGLTGGQKILDATFNYLDFKVPLSLSGSATFLAIADVTFSDSGFFTTTPPTQIVLALELDGLVKIPPQIPLTARYEDGGYLPNYTQDLAFSLDPTIRLSPTVIPEASTMTLMGIGMGFLAASRVAFRRRK